MSRITALCITLTIPTAAAVIVLAVTAGLQPAFASTSPRARLQRHKTHRPAPYRRVRPPNSLRADRGMVITPPEGRRASGAVIAPPNKTHFPGGKVAPPAGQH